MLASGFEPSEVRRWLRDGQLLAVRRGSYVTEALPARPELRHLLRVRAALPDVAPDAVVSHVSAALAHGLNCGASCSTRCV